MANINTVITGAQRTNKESTSMHFNYTSDTTVSTGYEDLYDTLKGFNRDKYLMLDEEEKVNTLEYILGLYRSKNIFPIQYFNEEGIKNELLKCRDREVGFTDNVLNLKLNQGSSLCRMLFPNMADVECGGDKRTPYKKFHSDHMLKRAIEFCLKHKKSNHPVLPSGIKDGLEMLGGGVATNYKPMNAKALYERYVPVGGTIYDYSAGFGGRMLGAISSSNDYTYIGVEPCAETFANLQNLKGHLDTVFELSDKIHLTKTGSEDYTLEDSTVDFAFSSPPYFNLENYSEEATQSHIKFNNLDSWFDGYVSKTLSNIHGMLKPEGFYAVNIADFKVGQKKTDLVDRWIACANASGFTLVEVIKLKLETRRGEGHGGDKKEGIYVFKKQMIDK
jgi:hypothetical protein